VGGSGATPQSYSNRGIAYGNKGEYDRAIADYGKAIEINPKYVGADNGRGSAYSRRDEAIADFRRALAVGANDQHPRRLSCA
jgi:tetratricopeptide (TPR) repeat protein